MDKTEIMRQCIALAKESAAEGEVPVGAAVVKNGEIIATGRNRRELDKNALCHAEIEAIDKACRMLHGWRLWECELYVTLEPCPMCAGAILNARLQKVTYGARDPAIGQTRQTLSDRAAHQQLCKAKRLAGILRQRRRNAPELRFALY